MARRARGALLALLCLLPTGVAAAQPTAVAAEPGAVTEERARVFDALVDVFRRHYWDEDRLDWDAWAAAHRDRVLAAATRAEFDRLLTEMVAEVGDNHSNWLGLVRYADPERLPVGWVAARPHAEMLDPVTGYLLLPSLEPEGIGASAHQLLRQLVEQGAEALVLDLRSNAGGRLAELGLVLGAFQEGPWVRAESRGRPVWVGSYARSQQRGRSVLAAPSGALLAERTVERPAVFRGEVVVIVDGRSASAAEVAALALQRSGRAVIVGEGTPGSLEAVRAFDLPDGSRVVVAVARLVGADGRPFTAGVVPDVTATGSPAQLARGHDAPLAAALRVLKRSPFTPERYFSAPAGAARP